MTGDTRRLPGGGAPSETETGTFRLSAAFGLIGLVYFLCVVPGTKGRDLEEMEEDAKVRGAEGGPSRRGGKDTGAGRMSRTGKRRTGEGPCKPTR